MLQSFYYQVLPPSKENCPAVQNKNHNLKLSKNIDINEVIYETKEELLKHFAVSNERLNDMNAKINEILEIQKFLKKEHDLQLLKSKIFEKSHDNIDDIMRLSNKTVTK